MSLNACAALVERSDPDRFRATMAAPVAARRVLFPIYAFNVEVTRAPWVTQEEMIAEMRLQWWRDALEEIGAGGSVRKHEVVDALAGILDPEGAKTLDDLVAARRWDVYKDAFEDRSHLNEYIDATSGALMWTAARLLGGTDEAGGRAFAYGVGIANLLRAVPDLEDRGRKPLVDGTAAGVKALALDGLASLKRGNAPKAVKLSGFQAAPILKQAIADPSRVANGTLGLGPIRQATHLVRIALSGEFWPRR
ncbi:MAG: squalene/phytoene synthase family protein [Yoonia sp.]|nr:squalene/phytoene synthase family protein [Yoonia sp.]